MEFLTYKATFNANLIWLFVLIWVFEICPPRSQSLRLLACLYLLRLLPHFASNRIPKPESNTFMNLKVSFFEPWHEAMHVPIQ